MYKGKRARFEYNKVIIPYGTIVFGKKTRCDGRVDCKDQKDEQGCGLGSFQSSLLGKFFSTQRILCHSKL